MVGSGEWMWIISLGSIRLGSLGFTFGWWVFVFRVSVWSTWGHRALHRITRCLPGPSHSPVSTGSWWRSPTCLSHTPRVPPQYIFGAASRASLPAVFPPMSRSPDIAAAAARYHAAWSFVVGDSVPADFLLFVCRDRTKTQRSKCPYRLL